MTNDKVDVGMAGASLGFDLVALAAACYGYFVSGTGTAYTGGALLVIVASLLIFGAMLVEAGLDGLNSTARTILDLLLVLGFAGTALAGGLLMNWALVAAIILAAGAWIVWRARGTHPRPHEVVHS